MVSGFCENSLTKVFTKCFKCVIIESRLNKEAITSVEIREVTQYSEKAPFTGYGVWVVFEMKYHKVNLLHPITFTEMYLSQYEFVKACGNSLWPFNSTGKAFSLDRFLSSFKERIRFFIDNNRTFPAELCAKVLSEMQEISMEEARSFINSLALESGEELRTSNYYSLDKKDREFILREDANCSSIRGRPLAIIEALRGHGPATMEQITELVDGRLKTKCKLSRAVTYFVNKMTSQGILEIVA
jgi:hypothetical protein